MTSTAGRGKVNKDVVEYGRRLIRNGWTKLDDDPVGNPRFARDGHPAVLTLPRGGRGRWRQDADRLVAAVTGRKTGRTFTTQRRPTVLAELGSAEAAEARVQAATVRNLDERRRRALMAAEDNFNSYRALMSAAPNRW